MAKVLFLARKMGGLFPTDRQSEKLLAEYPEFDCLKATITQPRNVKHHKKYWALLGVIAPYGGYNDEEHFHDDIKRALGMFDMVKNAFTGQMEQRLHSISFSKMDQKAFEVFYAKVEELILTRIVPNVNKADLEANVLEIMEGRKN